MTTYNTGNPLGSVDVKDLYDNSQNLDELVNSQTKLSEPDRLGVARKTWKGMETEFSESQTNREAVFVESQEDKEERFTDSIEDQEDRFQQFLADSGFVILGQYAPNIQVTAYNQLISANGEFWRLSASTPLPYTTTGAGMPEGGAFVAAGEATLRDDLASTAEGKGASLVKFQGGKTLQDLSSTAAGDGAALVGFKQAGTGAVDRTALDKMRELVSVKDFGAVGDGVADDTAAIQAAIATGRTVWFPGHSTYRITSPLVANQSWIQDVGAIIRWDGANSSGSVLTFGQQSISLQNREIVLEVERSSIDWSGSLVGVTLINIANSKIKYRRVFGFKVGVRELGWSEGFAYNSIDVGILISCQTLIEWVSKGTGSPVGYHNENTYFKGRLGNFSNSPTGVPRIGVHVRSDDGAYTNNNSNVWFAPSFELFDGGLPVYMQHGSQNSFLYYRDEQNGPIFAKEENNSGENEYVGGYSDNFLASSKLSSTSSVRSSFLVNSRTRLKQFAYPIFQSGRVIDRCNYYQFSRLNTAGLSLHEGNSGVNSHVNLLTNFEMTESTLNITSSARGVGISFDTSRLKKMAIVPNLAETGGRIVIIPYDANNNVLPPTSGSHVFSAAGRTFSPVTAIFTGYLYGVDLPAGADAWYQIELSDDVRFVDIIFTGGTQKLQLKSFSIFGFAIDDSSRGAAFLRSCRDVNIGIQKPTQGKHKAGMTIYNANAAVGQPIGWQCITGGEFGVSSPVYATLPNLAA
jgi:hypothetical protein